MGSFSSNIIGGKNLLGLSVKKGWKYKAFGDPIKKNYFTTLYEFSNRKLAHPYVQGLFKTIIGLSWPTLYSHDSLMVRVVYRRSFQVVWHVNYSCIAKYRL